jgi:hypothetical protein
MIQPGILTTNPIIIFGQTFQAQSTPAYSIQLIFLAMASRLDPATVISTVLAMAYIYAAFAESPSFNLYGGQANAR